MSKRKLFWQTAKTINWSSIFQALNDLLLIALPTIGKYDANAVRV